MKTILVIDDTSEILDNLIEFLQMEGYKTLAASNGRIGFEMANKLLPDLIICDVLMPEMDGHEVLNLLINTSRTRNIPFIFSTSMSEKVERAEALALGADDYIVKPYEPERLLKLIEFWIKNGSKRDLKPIIEE
ncbi:MAG: response regulator [Candidatus Dadabacteria bacterium]